MNQSRRFFLVGVAMVFLCGCSGPPEQPSRPAVVSVDSDVVECPVVVETALTPTRARPRMVSHGFAVLDFRARRDEYDRVAVIGEIKNVGPGLRGVELQAILRDEAGRLVAVAHFYPASEYSIGADETWPFAYSLGKQTEAAKAELRIVGSFRTLEILNAKVL